MKYLIIALGIWCVGMLGLVAYQHHENQQLIKKLETSQQDLKKATDLNKENEEKFTAAIALQKNLAKIAQDEAAAARTRAEKHKEISNAIKNTPDNGTGVAPVIVDTVERLWNY